MQKKLFFLLINISAAILMRLGAGNVLAQTDPVVLRLDPGQNNWQPQKEYILKIKADTGENCINAARVEIAFPPDLIKIVDFPIGKSLISLWTKLPRGNDIKSANVSGLFSFEGGIPGGYCARQTPGSEENNILGEIILKTTAAAVAAQNPAGAPIMEVKILETSQVYLNDGLGTLAQTTFGNAEFINATSTETGAPGSWAGILKNDTTPPDQFEIKINQDKLFRGGKYFITFQTGDKQTGIDRFEISETPLGKPSAKDKWKTGASPYVLEDQTLRSKIKVKAYDLAGNETVSEYSPQFSGADIDKKQAAAILMAILIAGGLIVFAFRRRWYRNEKK
jgi:hypothetical protein